MKPWIAITATTIAVLAQSLHADPSLQACSKQKIRQMELIQKQHTAAPVRTGKKLHGTARDPRRQIEQIDEWLWKNCRSHAAEMRTIEQQYM